jgi:hypothetical protein
MQGTDSWFAKAGLLLIPVLGISTAWCLTDIIVREHVWQGHYIRALRRVQEKMEEIPQIYDSDPVPNRPGYIARRFLFLRWVLVVGWGALVVVVVLLDIVA